MKMNGPFKMIRKTVMLTALAAIFMMPHSLCAYAAETESAENTLTDTAEDAATVDPVNAFLEQSAFIGNSVGEGLTMYNNAKGKVPLGNATMLTRVCYSFYNDAGRNQNYIPKYNGVAMQAKEAVKQCGAGYVFICMGTNDLVGKTAVESALGQYQQYIAGILAESPEVTVFIESCTPSRPGSNVSNSKITAFNAYMQSYCDLFPNMYYVDIASPMKDAEGYLSASLCSDGSVHLTNKAYALWADTIRKYIADFIAARAAAIKEQSELERAQARANYESDMKKMQDKKQEIFEIRMQARREAEAAEAEKRRQELLNVPDEATLMRMLRAKEESKYVAAVGLVPPGRFLPE